MSGESGIKGFNMRGVKVKFPPSVSSRKSTFSRRMVILRFSYGLVHAGIQHILHQPELSLNTDQRAIPESYHTPHGVGERDECCTGTDNLFKRRTENEIRGIPGKKIPDR